MRKSKNADNERLDAASMEKVIELLANKGTKKAACEILNISYNTTRLNTLIEKYQADKAREAKRRAEKRGKPATPDECKYAVQAYLEGEAIDSIAKSLYRGSTFVKNILINYGVPLRSIPHSYYKPSLIPDESVRDKFKVGEKVYSVRYDSLANVEGEFKPGIYRVWLISPKWQQFAYQEAHELASLDAINTKLEDSRL